MLSTISKEHEQDGQAQSEHQENKKTLQWQFIPKIILRPPRTFFLKGMIFIDLNKKRISPISNVNFYKHVSSSVILRDLGLFYEDISTNTSHFDSPSVVIQQLKNESNKDMNELANKLEGYEEFSKTNEMVKQQIKSLILANSQLKALATSKRLEFEQLRKDKISQIQKHKYVKFVDIAFDYTDMSPKKTGTGMTEAFVKLLGCDLQSMQAISMRKGIISMIDDESRWQLLNKIINLIKSKMQEEFHYKGNMSLITLDDIVINTNFSVDSFLCKSGEIFSQFFHPSYKKYTYDRGIIFFELEITDSHVQQINQIRKQIISGKEQHLSICDRGLNDYHPFILPRNAGNNELEKTHKSSLTQQPIRQSSQMRLNSKMLEASTIQQCQKEKDEQKIICSIQPKINKIVSNLVNDIPYVVQSQDFLERFYGTAVAQAAIQKSEIEDQSDDKDVLKNKICGFTSKQW